MLSKIETSYGQASKLEVDKKGEKQGTVFIAPGFGEVGTRHFKEVAEAISEHGFKAVTFDHPDKRGDESDPLKRRQAIIQEILSASLEEGEKAHLVGHSLGAYDLLMVAAEHPNLVASITLLQPSGLTKEQSLLEIGNRVSKKVINNQTDIIDNIAPLSNDDESEEDKFRRIALAQIAGGNSLGKKPVLSFKEANAARLVNATEVIKAVSDHGITINLITSQNDELYDSNQVEQWVAENPDSFTSWSMRADEKANHDNSWIEHKTTGHVLADIIKQQAGSLAVRGMVQIEYDSDKQDDLVA